MSLMSRETDSEWSEENSQNTSCEDIDIDIDSVIMRIPSLDIPNELTPLFEDADVEVNLSTIKTKIVTTLQQLRSAPSQQQRIDLEKHISRIILLSLKNATLGQLVSESDIFQTYTQLISVQEETFTYFALSGLQLLTAILYDSCLNSCYNLVPAAFLKICALMQTGYLSRQTLEQKRTIFNRYLGCFKIMMKIIYYDTCRQLTSQQLLSVNALVMKLVRLGENFISMDNINEIVWYFYQFSVRTNHRIKIYQDQHLLQEVLTLLEPFTAHFYTFLYSIFSSSDRPNLPNLKQFLQAVERDLSNQNTSHKIEILSCLIIWIYNHEDQNSAISQILIRPNLLQMLLKFHKTDSVHIRRAMLHLLDRILNSVFSHPHPQEGLAVLKALNVVKILLKIKECRNRLLSTLAVSLICKLFTGSSKWVYHKDYYYLVIGQLINYSKYINLAKKCLDNCKILAWQVPQQTSKQKN